MEKETLAEKLTAPLAKGPNPPGPEPPVNGKPSGVRTASKEQFEKAHRKTAAIHAGLFRRLAK